MSKRNIAYTRPDDPSFLKRIKEQIGYKDGPSIETKRQKLDSENEDFTDSEDEQPQVVVLKQGDLTLEEVELEKQRILKEESEKPANLTERILFKPKLKLNKLDLNEKDEQASTTTSSKSSLKTNQILGGDKKISKINKDLVIEGPKNRINKQDKSKLSFNDEDEEEEDND